MNDESDANPTSAVNRREFIRVGGIAGVAAAASVPTAAQPARDWSKRIRTRRRSAV